MADGMRVSQGERQVSWVNEDIVQEDLRHSLPPYLLLDGASLFFLEEERPLGNLDLHLPMLQIKCGQNISHPVPQFLPL